MENYKIKVSSEAESKEAQELFFELGGRWAAFGRSYNDMVELGDYVFLTDSSMLNYGLGIGKEEITIPQLKDMVVLKRNDPKDSNVSEENCLYDLYLTDSGDLYFYHCGKNEWILSNLNGDEDYYKSLKPIEKPMKEFLNKLTDGTYKLVVLGGDVDGVEGLIEVPEGADTLAGDERTHYFWKHGVGVKGNMLIGCGESLSRYPKWDDCEDSADEWLGQINCKNSRILWQRETLPEALPFIDDEPKYDPEDIGIAKGYDLDELAKEYKLRDRCEGETDEEYRYMLEHCISKESINDKVASAEVARQSGVFVGAPFDDLPEFDFEAVDEFVESNVEQTLSDRESTYGSFRDVAELTSSLMNDLLRLDMSFVQREALHMICSKLARIANGDPNHIDSWHDIAGYATLVVKDINGNS